MMTTYLYGFPANYSPAATHNPHHPRQSPTPDPVDALETQFKAAKDVHASHLASDGETAYDIRFGYLYHCAWDAGRRAFGSWLRDGWGEGVPVGAVVVE